MRTMPRPADVIELIMADHRRIRRLREALYDTVRHVGDSGQNWMLGHVWQRLAGLLEVHSRAEEEVCYLPMFGSGPGAAELRHGAIADHDDIREALREASLQRVGSAPWWRAVTGVLACSAEHHEREEREMLARCELTVSQRLELGRQWSAFVAAWARDTGPQGHPRPVRSPGPVVCSPGPVVRSPGPVVRGPGPGRKGVDAAFS
jgi:hypothetical protein